ncbi:hypothetical protein L3X38_003616 [Prunus dulcis]|uniref:Uncharacterized protein n=1 Tax=Prunus dulcis TaxID=3755 RepID=A0AAD4ZMF0_PRUDU|nr:hypothetical protein L3X38_003616 [Prunus dulcis]
MDRNNFLSWRSQFFDVLEIHDLEDVVKNENCPAKRLEDGSINPTYAKDKLVLSWIKATASPSIKTLLISFTSAYKAWTLLEKRLSPLSKTHLRTLRDQICSLKKEPKKEFTTSLHLRPSFTFDEFYDFLIQEEHLIKRMSSLSTSTRTAFVADRTSNNQQDHSNPQPYTDNNNRHNMERDVVVVGTGT